MKKYHVHVRPPLLKNVNPIIKFFIFSDIFIIGSSGLWLPVFAIFIERFIEGGNAAVAGMAIGTYLLVKSVFQIPIASLIDSIKGEKDDITILIVFSILMSLTPLLYLVISTPIQLYIVQFFYGIVVAFTFPTFMALFTRHIDHEREGTEWGIYYTLTDLAYAALAIAGGYIAATEGFTALILAVVAISLIGSLFLIPIKNKVLSE